MKLNKEKSFTLIELLIVIAVVGMISSIILVNLNLPEQRKKAQIGRALEFSSSILNALGSEGVGTWNFDEGSGSTAKDSSGYKNNCSIIGPTYTSETPQSITGTGSGKYALSFDGADDYLDCGSDPSLIPSSAFTFEAWIYPKKIMCSKENDSCPLWGTGANAYGHIIAIAQNGFLWFYTLHNEWDPFDSDKPVAINTWTHVVFTWDGNKKRIYINGVLSGEKSISTPLKNLPPTWIGRKGDSHSGYFDGYIDEVRIYGQGLTTTQIREHYVQGLKKHNLTYQNE